MAAAGLGMLLERRSCRAWWAIGLILLPGTYSSLEGLGPEPLGLALVVWALVRWTDETDRSVFMPVVLFGLAGLARETFLLVPAALALSAFRHRRVREAFLLATSAGGWIVWTLIVRARAGAWPTSAGEGRLTRPLEGAFTALRDAPAANVLPYLVMGVAIVATTAVLCRDDALWPIVIVHAAFGVLLGRFVWIDWHAFTRVLLPMYALGVVAVLGRVLGAPDPSGRTSVRRVAAADSLDARG
jgi:hypothetical protein